MSEFVLGALTVTVLAPFVVFVCVKVGVFAYFRAKRREREWRHKRDEHGKQA